MTKPLPIFDIMIVYDANLAFSAADHNYHESTPFAVNGEYFSCNACYQYFIQYCRQQHLTAAFTTTNDIDQLGHFSSAWTYDREWKRYQHITQAKVIFDKFSNLLARLHKAYQLLTNSLNPLILFHNQATRMLLDDKFKTYLKFPNYAIPTVKIDTLDEEHLQKAKKALRSMYANHPYRDDFDKDFVLKDQFGMGGNNIFKISNDDCLNMPFDSSTKFILQPFINASGFNIADYTGNTDLRVIVCNNIIIQSYLRIAKTGEFRANAQQGGKVVYLNLNQIPREVIDMATDIKQRLPSKTALYALDFIKSGNGHLYFIEGNNSPGLIWFDREDETRAKQLIHLIVNNLKRLAIAP